MTKEEKRKWAKEYYHSESGGKKIRTSMANNYETLGKKKRIERRLIALRHYSETTPPSCACCGENRYEFLAIDHMNGGGKEHRRVNKITNLAEWLIRNNFPDGFRVLCHNCNMSLGFYGYCPHQTERIILKPESYGGPHTFFKRKRVRGMGKINKENA